MPPISNAELKREIEELHASYKEHVEQDRLSFAQIEARMSMYEHQIGENNTILKSVQLTVDGYEKRIRNFLAFLKWLATIISLILASVISAWIISHH